MTEGPYRKPSLGTCYWLSDNVKRLRAARGYTQEDMGARCGLHKNYISDVERSNVDITLGNLEALATGFGCWEEELLRRAH